VFYPTDAAASALVSERHDHVVDQIEGFATQEAARHNEIERIDG